MTMDNTQEYEVTFSESIGKPILDITKKYGLIESKNEFTRKLENDLPMNGEILRLMVEDLVLGKNKKEKLPELLQAEFKISQEKAVEMAKDAEEKVLIFAQRVPKSELKEEETEEKEQSNKPANQEYSPLGGKDLFPKANEELSPEDIKPTAPKLENHPPAETKQTTEYTENTEKKASPVKKFQEPVEVIKKQSKEPDNYREPIGE